MSSDSHGAIVPTSSGLKQPYHLVDPSPWPLMGAAGGGMIVTGIILAAHYGNYILLAAGAITVFTTMYFWWRDVVRESRTPGLHTPVVRIGLRYGMILFISSEVMFFVAFFWAFFNSRFLVNPSIHQWPPANIQPMEAWGIPFLNTLILLSSGLAVNWAHHSLRIGDRGGLKKGLALAVVLGFTFLSLQAYEYGHAAFSFHEGIFPSVFYMATGFHGFHVFVGACFLSVNFFRAVRGDFTPEQHVGFEAAAWYWHFVDVVWIFLFVWVYWFGA